MKFFWLIILFFALSGTIASAQTLSSESKTQNNDSSDTEKVDRLFTQWNKPDSPGCSLAVIRDGKIIYEKGYGTADLEHEILISPQTVFHAGSIAFSSNDIGRNRIFQLEYFSFNRNSKRAYAYFDWDSGSRSFLLYSRTLHRRRRSPTCLAKAD